ncbi:MAG: DUF2147 domain-containing protein [Tidjanibacter sp.]|nr:DUF2147 domain-containing protein [Tidjanibacter sp.]
MKRSALLVTFVLLAIGSAFAQKADDILGTYMSHDRDGRFEVYRDGNLFQGVMVWSEKEPAKQGSIVLRNLRYNADRNEYTGKIFDTRFNKEYNVRVKVEPDGNLKVSPWWGPVKMNFIWPRTTTTT